MGKLGRPPDERTSALHLKQSLRHAGAMSLTALSTVRASEPQGLHNAVWDVRHSMLTRPRPHRAAARSQDTCRPEAERRCLRSALARHG